MSSSRDPHPCANDGSSLSDSSVEQPARPNFTNVLLLAIETATDVCSVALFEGDVLLTEMSVAEPRSHAAQLVPLIQRALRDCAKSPVELDVVAVSAGPGSYTGLRIGASTAKGLAFAADAALVAVPSLEALACSATTEGGFPVLVVFPSRRGEVYAAAFLSRAGGLEEIRETAAVELIGLDAWMPEGDAIVVGPASQSVMDTIGDPKRLQHVDRRLSARHVAKLGIEQYNSGRIENVAAWEPFYLNSFIAKPPRPIFG